MFRGRLSVFSVILLSLLLRIGTAQGPRESRHELAARALLLEGKVEPALKRALLAYNQSPHAPSLQTLLGDICYRMADFDRAESHYRAAVATSQSEARAWLGLGRLDLLRFNRRAAREKMARAYALEPRDPEVLRAYAANSNNTGTEVALLKELLGLSAAMAKKDRELVLGQILLHEKTGGRSLGALASPYRSYELPLNLSREGALVLHVAVNQGAPLRLILDSGARGIVITNRAAASLGLRYIVPSSLEGLGDSGPIRAHTALAETVRIGELAYKDCIIEVTDGKLSEQADGVIGTILFEQFIICIDIPHRAIDLFPFADGVPRAAGGGSAWADWDRTVSEGMEHFIPAYQINGVILVQAQIKSAGTRYFILDTGAASSSVSRSLAPNVNIAALGTPLMFHGAGGDIQNLYRAFPFSLQIGARSYFDPALIAMDLRAVSDREGVEISGIIGFPMVAHSRISIDYRDGLLNVDDGR